MVANQTEAKEKNTTFFIWGDRAAKENGNYVLLQTSFSVQSFKNYENGFDLNVSNQIGGDGPVTFIIWMTISSVN